MAVVLRDFSQIAANPEFTSSPGDTAFESLASNSQYRDPVIVQKWVMR